MVRPCVEGGASNVIVAVVVMETRVSVLCIRVYRGDCELVDIVSRYNDRRRSDRLTRSVQCKLIVLDVFIVHVAS